MNNSFIHHYPHPPLPHRIVGLAVMKFAKEWKRKQEPSHSPLLSYLQKEEGAGYLARTERVEGIEDEDLSAGHSEVVDGT